MNIGRFIVVPALLSTALALSGCYGEAQYSSVPVTSAEVETSDGYEPAYYDGYVVYYDSGRPYYYNRGAVVWIGANDPHYGGLVHHYNVYGPRYSSWNAHYGARYRTYRSAPGHNSYHGHRSAPPARRVR